MLRNLSIFIFVFVLAAQLKAQYSPINTISWNNNSLYNPAATAINYKHDATIGSAFDNNRFYGQEWNSSSYALYNYRWDKINSGIGVSYEFYNSDFRTRSRIAFNYAYQFHLKDDRLLSLGASYGFDRVTINYSNVQSWGIEPLRPIPSEDETYTLSDARIGAMFKSHKLLVGISLDSRTNIHGEWNDVLTLSMNMSYDFSVGNNFKLSPGIYAFTKIDYFNYADLSLKTTFKDRYWIGMVVDFADPYSSVGGFAGIDIKGNYRIGYSYRRFSMSNCDVNELVFRLMIK